MLAIRLQRQGRKNYAKYRVIVQEARNHPTSGRIIRYLGHYDPHTKTAELSVDEIKQLLDNGAQPSPAVARLFKSNGVKLPKWVKLEKSVKKSTKNPDKLRKNRPAEAEAEPKAAPAEDEQPAEDKAEAKPPADAADETAATGSGDKS